MIIIVGMLHCIPIYSKAHCRTTKLGFNILILGFKILGFIFLGFNILNLGFIILAFIILHLGLIILRFIMLVFIRV